MRAEMVLVRIARQSGRSIKLSAEAIEEIYKFLDFIVVKEKIEELYKRDLLEKMLIEIQEFNALGMTLDECWDFERNKIIENYPKERYSFRFNRPTIRHQVINRKPRHLVKKIIR